MERIKCVKIYLRRMKKIQNELLKVLNSEEDKEFLYHSLNIKLDELKVAYISDLFRSFLHLLAKLYENRHQQPDNIRIIENVILYYKNDILNYFLNCEIFTIFKNDKKLLLFLLESKILTIDEFVINKMKEDEYSSYFFPEIKNYLEKSKIEEISAKIPNDFTEKRKIGENDSYLSELIRNDSIEEFISYISKTNLSLKSTIKGSIFETNTFLINKEPTLIEYATFFGSIRVFQYLLSNNVNLTESLWLYAIHSQNTEIISILEDNNIKPMRRKKAINFYEESIRCHQNDIADYILNNYIDNNKEDNSKISSTNYFKSYNFIYIKLVFINESHFFNFCRFDYPLFVSFLMENMSTVALNKQIYQKEILNGKTYSIEKSALYVAIKNDNNEVVRILLSNDDIDINHIYRTFLIVPLMKFNYLDLLYATLISFILSLISSFFIVFTINLFICIILHLYQDIKEITNVPFSIRILSAISTISSKSINYINEEFTLLHLAVINDNVEIVEMLSSKKNININAIYKNQIFLNEESTALNLAVKYDYNQIVKVLLSNPNIDVNYKYKYKTPKSMNYGFFKLSGSIVFYLAKPTYILYVICLILFIVENRRIIKKICLLSLIIGVLMNFILKYSLHCSILDIIVFLNDKIFNFILSIPFLCIRNIVEKVCTIYIIIELLFSLLYTAYTVKTPLQAAIENNNFEIVKLLSSNENIDANS